MATPSAVPSPRQLVLFLILFLFPSLRSSLALPPTQHVRTPTTYSTEVVEALEVIFQLHFVATRRFCGSCKSNLYHHSLAYYMHACLVHNYRSGTPSLSDFSHCRLGIAGEGELTDPSDPSVPDSRNILPVTTFPATDGLDMNTTCAVSMCCIAHN